MNSSSGSEAFGKAKTAWGKFKYPAIALILGLAIMLLPVGKADDGNSGATGDEERLESVLSECDGVGSVKVLLSDTGAVIVCTGADSPEVRLMVTRAVKAFTGFSTDSIQVVKSASDIGG